MKESSFPLSVREREVLKFVAKGLSNKEIALSMRISPSTVKRHVENILRRLHLKNRIEAAVYFVTKVNFPAQRAGHPSPILVKIFLPRFAICIDSTRPPHLHPATPVGGPR